MKPRNPMSSLRGMHGLAVHAPHILAPLILIALSFAVAGCSSSPTTPPNPLDKVPDFIFVSNVSGGDQLYTYHRGVTTLFPGSIAGDADPQSAAGKVVFTTYRISYLNPEIYISNLDGSNAVRLTNSPGTDKQPSLSPDTTTVLFMSTRTGTPRVWTMKSDGTSQTEVATGSNESVPEGSARFSPAGGRFLFSSPRTNTNQIFVMPSTGGAATQVTHEVNGAFNGSWSADGNSIFYVDGSDRTTIHNVVVATGAVTNYVTGGTDVGQPECNAALCLVVSGATSASGEILAYIGSGSTSPLTLLHTSANEREPAILHP